MSKRLMIGLAATAIAATVSSMVSAGPLRSEMPDRSAAAKAELLPAYDILSAVRAVGLLPYSAPSLRGPYYVLHAIGPTGSEVRVVADAQFGDILSVLPAYPWRTAYYAPYGGGPRIIHVPDDYYDKAAPDAAAPTREGDLSAAPAAPRND